MTGGAQPTTASFQTTASTASSSGSQTSRSPDPITSKTSSEHAESQQPITPVQAQDKDPRELTPSEEPNIDIEEFDWAGLEQRYHAEMQACAATEAALFEEFNQAIRLFESWASVTTTHENDRSYKRLKTRICYVQGDEQRLEKKRQHHTKVVAAFESALALLREP
ncbi:hypothetical protein MMC26_004341 [Xylographa opegraphella]|nr:hypothetical protein [Xylographa opegraphella]